MKAIVCNSSLALLTFSSVAFAANGTGDTEGGFLLSLFVGFFALILVFQIVPAFLLFWGMIRGLVSQDGKEANGIKH